MFGILYLGGAVTNLHYGDVSVQHGEGEGSPASTVGMHGGVFWGARGNLTASKELMLHIRAHKRR